MRLCGIYRKRHGASLLGIVIFLCTHAALAAEDQCAVIEQGLAARPLVMLSALYKQRCLGAENDAAAITKTIDKIVPAKLPERDASDTEMRYIVESALDAVDGYVRAALPADAVTSPAPESVLLSQLSKQIVVVRQAVSAGADAGIRNSESWRYKPGETTLAVPGLDLSPLDVECETAAAPVCQKAAATGKVVIRSLMLVQRALSYRERPLLGAALVSASVRDRKWTAYFDDARLQFPWELALNGYLYKQSARKVGGFADPPSHQWIVLHPTVGLEYVRGAQSGSRFEPALVLEVSATTAGATPAKAAWARHSASR